MPIDKTTWKSTHNLTDWMLSHMHTLFNKSIVLSCGNSDSVPFACARLQYGCGPLCAVCGDGTMCAKCMEGATMVDEVCVCSGNKWFNGVNCTGNNV